MISLWVFLKNFLTHNIIHILYNRNIVKDELEYLYMYSFLFNLQWCIYVKYQNMCKNLCNYNMRGFFFRKKTYEIVKKSVEVIHFKHLKLIKMIDNNYSMLKMNSQIRINTEIVRVQKTVA